MIDGKTLSRCIDILSELNARANDSRDKNRILELGYIIKQELDLVRAWESEHSEQKMKRGGAPIMVDKLLEDNAQLYKENETLLKNLEKLKNIVESKLPIIERHLEQIDNQFGSLNSFMEKGIC
jgi:hypothetical protein